MRVHLSDLLSILLFSLIINFTFFFTKMVDMYAGLYLDYIVDPI